MGIIDKYNLRADAVNSLVCVGLDSEFAKIPEEFKKNDFPQFAFNQSIIEATQEFAATFKINIAFYEARGDEGLKEMKMTMDYIHEHYPQVFTICDAKRADIGNTNQAYAEEIFDWLEFDAITLHPYLGQEALEPFLERVDKGCIILCRTSNPGAGELQDLVAGGESLWKIIAKKVVAEWNANGNCMLVMGATYPKELKEARELAGDMTFLVPGIGTQDGDIKETIEAGLNGEKKGMIINSSRGIIFAANPKEEAKKLRDEINVYRQ